MLMNSATLRRAASTSALTSVLLWIVLLLGIFIVGALTALAPDLMVRLAPLIVIPVFVVVAAFRSNRSDLGPRFMRIWIMLLACMLSLWPTYLSLKIGSAPSLDGRKLMMLAAVVIFVYLVVNRPVIRQALFFHRDSGTHLVGFIILAYIALRYVSLHGASFPVHAFIVLSWDLVYYYFLYYFAIACLRHPDCPATLQSAFFWATLFMAILVLLEKVQGINYLALYAPTGGDVGAMQALSRLRDGVLRAQGTFEHPITLAEYASMVSGFSLAALLWARRMTGRLFALLVLMTSLAVNLASASRSGLVCAGAAMLLVFVLWMYRARKVQSLAGLFGRQVLVIGTLVGAVVLAAPVIWLLTQGRSTNEKLSSLARSEMLDRGVPSVIDNPFIGTGFGTAGQIAGHVGNGGLLTLDNHYLGIAIESGVPAVLLFTLSLLIPLLRAVQAVLSRPSPHAAFLAGAAGALAVLLIIRGTMWLSTNLAIGYLLAGLVMVFSRPVQSWAAEAVSTGKDRTAPGTHQASSRGMLRA